MYVPSLENALKTHVMDVLVHTIMSTSTLVVHKMAAADVCTNIILSSATSRPTSTAAFGEPGFRPAV